MASGAKQESVVIDPVEMLQASLGVDEAQAKDLASIEVACPIPGEDRQASLGEFMTSEHGADKASEIVELATQAKEKGADPEAALASALGFAAVRDRETGGLARVSLTESKKK